MNRILFRPNLKPELKMVQPLPAYASILAGQRRSASAPAAVVSRPEVQPQFPLATGVETGAAAVRMVAS